MKTNQPSSPAGLSASNDSTENPSCLAQDSYPRHQMLQDSFPERILCEAEIDLSDKILRGAVEFGHQSFLFLGSNGQQERIEKALLRWKALGQPRLEFAFLADGEAKWLARLEQVLSSLEGDGDSNPNDPSSPAGLSASNDSTEAAYPAQDSQVQRRVSFL